MMRRNLSVLMTSGLDVIIHISLVTLYTSSTGKLLIHRRLRFIEMEGGSHNSREDLPHAELTLRSLG